MNIQGLARDIAIVAITWTALQVIMWGFAYIREAITDMRLVAEAVTDPADIQKWAVLAEARRITEEAADHDAG
jgi:hypothetical protein